MYELFDDPTHRANRGTIWNELDGRRPIDLTDDEWTIVENTATQMDVVGIMARHRLVRPELIYERYAEVICPLWKSAGPLVLARRVQKGGFGWNNFEWMAGEALRWSEQERGITEYRRIPRKRRFRPHRRLRRGPKR